MMQHLYINVSYGGFEKNGPKSDIIIKYGLVEVDVDLLEEVYITVEVTAAAVEWSQWEPRRQAVLKRPKPGT